jgi:hypothetical protein
MGTSFLGVLGHTVTHENEGSQPQAEIGYKMSNLWVCPWPAMRVERRRHAEQFAPGTEDGRSRRRWQAHTQGRSAEPLMACNERTLLLKRCAITMHTYTRASIKWQALTGSDNTQAYRDSRSARAQARIQVDLATYELEQHECVHLCHPATATMK